jgi:hypothetical protein
MTSNLVNRVLSVTILMAAGLTSAVAAEQVSAEWDKLCTVTQRNELSVATNKGQTLKGTCESTTATEMTLRHSGTLVKVDRADISRIQMIRPRGRHQLMPVLGDQVAGMFLGGSSLLASSDAPAGLVLIPVSLAYGIVATPFVAVHDLAHKIFDETKSVDIQVL